MKSEYTSPNVTGRRCQLAYSTARTCNVKAGIRVYLLSFSNLQSIMDGMSVLFVSNNVRHANYRFESNDEAFHDLDVGFVALALDRDDVMA
jgi:hypothetical protein